MARVRTVDFLPEIFRTPTNKQFLNATLDQLVQEPQFKKSQGYVGRKVGPGINANDKYIIEPTKSRNDYQLEPGVIIKDPKTGAISDAITYPGINDSLMVQGADTTNPDRLYKSDYYTWDPFIDYDKFVNFSQYYWLPNGPDTVTISADKIPLSKEYTVTRTTDGYTFTDINGTNSTVSLVRGGTYTFVVAQNQKETINYRVSNQGTSAYLIDYVANPTLTLVRGNTYVFNLNLGIVSPFWIKTSPGQGITDAYNTGVSRNGSTSGIVTFTVPENAPDTLYYSSENYFNMSGQFNIVDATPGTGPKFWIQTDPGVQGKIPSTPNISSRDVLGVSNNGIDLGTITFEVPEVTAQSFYYNLDVVPNVDLATNLDFNQINNQPLEQFLTTYGGIDGITTLENKTLVFAQTNTGWTITNITGGFGSGFDVGTPITDIDQQYSVWQIQYQTIDGIVYIVLSSIRQVNALKKFSILYGAEFSNTQWYKNTDGYFERIPLLSAVKDVLYYQDGQDPAMFGKFQLVEDAQSGTIDVADIIGKKTYISPNGVTFTNGLKIQFEGSVIPSSYQNQIFYVEGVGSAIQLLPVSNFVTPENYTQNASIPYDQEPYDIENYDAALDQPLELDYLTINRASADLNAWTRSNRWFHIDVIDASATYNNTVATLDNAFRAKRPIIEFVPGMRLFNFGTEGKQPINVIDFTQTDAFTNVEGKTSYTVDGYSVIDGSRIIFANDSDPDVKNKIYVVNFITPDTQEPLITQPIINLVPATDADAKLNQVVVCVNGTDVKGVSFWFDGTTWIEAQEKIKINQSPLYDLYDSNGFSFGDTTVYPSTTFVGNKLFSYAVGTGSADPVLNFPLKYLSLNNVGDIVFDNNLYTGTFTYVNNRVTTTVDTSNGFVRHYNDRLTYSREIGWQNAITQSVVRQQFQFQYDGQPLRFDIKIETSLPVPPVQLYVADQYIVPSKYTLSTTDNTSIIVLNDDYAIGSIVEVQVLSNQTSSQGFYNVPINLENNPFNINSDAFTLGTIRTHYESICENLIDFQGVINGANNTRDLGNIGIYGTNILQESSPLTLAGFFMRSQDYNIFAALEYNDREYTKFKNKMLEASVNGDWGNQTTAEILDSIITELALERTDINPFYWSDMLPSGNIYVENSYTVSFLTTNTFDTVQTYDFTTSNFKGLLVFLNEELLTLNYDYTVATDGPRLTILRTLVNGDVVTIREYSNTAGNFVPNTPTKLGLYPSWKPEIFVNTDYIDPTTVIRGHDGSLTVTFGDIRDQILLEFERRIFNNLKNEGNSIPLSATDVIPGYFRKTDYSLSEINGILGESFLTWVGQNKLDYKTQQYNANNSFTYNYSSAGDRLKNESLPGAWRGIARYFYDTTSPSQTPWEMLGFTQMPEWWVDRYGDAPYTNENFILWDEIAAGYVADPAGAYFKPEYARPASYGLESEPTRAAPWGLPPYPSLYPFLPTNSEGQLLSPYDSVVGQFDPTAFKKSWVVGDGGPVESAWWSSSSYPFAIMRLLALTRPAEFFSLFADRDLYKYNADLEQYLYNDRFRLDASGIQIYGNGVSKASYINWIVDYNQQAGINSTTALETALANLDVRLCYRMAGFSDKQYLKIFTERSSPNSLNSSLLLPDESYSLLLYKNSPFAYLNYSSVIVQKTDKGYAVFGYATVDPYFNIYASRVTGNLQTISAGGVTVSVPKDYSENIVQVPYGFVFANETTVVDFLLSYGKYLEDQGLIFDNQENGYTLNWMQMAQEFLYWSNQGWGVGSLINLNPCADRLVAERPLSIVDSIANQNIENMLMDQNRQPFDLRNLVVERSDNRFEITSTTGQAISFIKIKFINYENIVILDNVSIFNDLIYEQATGARQNRINVTSVLTTEWNGTLNAQGFILNNRQTVKEWEPNKKYTKGEIVFYKNVYWSAQTIVQPKLEFDYNDWVKSDYAAIQSGLLPNISNKANQLANSYDTQVANIERDNDLLSFGLIGFKPREYMTSLNLDDVSQVNLYQEFLGTKGTIRSAEILTGANLGKEDAQYEIYENWAIKRGTYGANANRRYFEVLLNQALLTSNPSTVQLVASADSASEANQAVPVADIWKESYRITSPNVLPTTTIPVTDTALPSAGYVNINDVDITMFSLDDPTSIAENIEKIGIGTKIWVAKTNNYDWNVYRCNQTPGRVTSVSDNLDGTSQVTFSQDHNLSAGDLIIVRYFTASFNGVYRVLSTPQLNTITVAYTSPNNRTIETGEGIAFFLETMRVQQASDVSSLPYSTQLVPGARAWVDDNGSGLWEVLEKQQVFVDDYNLSATVPTASAMEGYSVAQTIDNSFILSGAPGYNSNSGSVYMFERTGTDDSSIKYYQRGIIELDTADTEKFGNAIGLGQGLWGIVGANESYGNVGYASILYKNPSTGLFSNYQLLVPPDLNFGPYNFGSAVSISQDERWIFVSAPGSNSVYCYGRVDVETQSVSYIADISTGEYNYSDSIVVDRGEQLVVTVDGVEKEYITDFIISEGNVIFVVPPGDGESIEISRRRIVEYIYDGSTDFDISIYLYTASNIDSFTVSLNGTLLRPEIDYDLGTNNELQFNVSLTSSDVITVVADTYWQFVQRLDSNGADSTELDPNAEFGFSLATTTNGRQVIVGCPSDIVTKMSNGVVVEENGSPVYIKSGSVSIVDRSVERYTVTDTDRREYSLPAGYLAPVSVLLNGVFLTNAEFYINGEFEIVGSNVIISNDVVLSVGDTIEIESNIFQRIQKVLPNNSFDEARFGHSVDICSNNCSLYIGSPQDGTVLVSAGSVQRNVNQARAYGVVSSNTANPTLPAGDSIRINNYEVMIPNSPNNTVSGLALAITPASYSPTTQYYTNDRVIYNDVAYVALQNSIGQSPNDATYWSASFMIPNVRASVSDNLNFVGDGSTTVFDIGTVYSRHDAYNPVVYVEGVLQVPYPAVGYDYTYTFDSTTSSGKITFVTAPLANEDIEVVTGILTLSVIDSAAAAQGSKLNVLPGVTGTSAFDDLNFNLYEYTQTIVSPNPTYFAKFGSSLYIDTSAVNLVVGAPTGNLYQPVTFDNNETYFDDRSTNFSTVQIQSGVVYTFDYLPAANETINNPGKFTFGQQIYNTEIKPLYQFGYAVNYTNGHLLIGTPGADYPIGSDSSDVTLENVGLVVVFENLENTPAWAVLHQQQPVVDIELMNSVYTYDKTLSKITSYLDFFNPLQGKILGVARQDIDYIGAVDPAHYNQGPIHNVGNPWGSEHVGQIWWDTNTVRFIDPNQDDIVYASRRWGQLFPGSRVDMYQWIESDVPPASYTGPGSVLSSLTYTVKTKLNNDNIFQTTYYFWVRNISTVDTVAGKKLSTAALANYIENPRASGIPYLAPLSASAFAVYNIKDLLSATDTAIHIEYDQELNQDNVHVEYELVATNQGDSFLSGNLYLKLQDSFAGYNATGRQVPDPTLSPANRYGVDFRPRQSMFADRFAALKNYLTKVNSVLKLYPISEIRRFTLLDSSQPEPTVASNEWNKRVANLEILSYQNIDAVALGYKYLVVSDADNFGLWTIYQVVEDDNNVRSLELVDIQNYDTKLYWNYIDWYDPGYNSTTKVVAEVPNYAGLEKLSVPVGSSVKITANANGKFEIYLLSDTGWNRVGLEDGTIEFSSTLWDSTFVTQYTDLPPYLETRKIIQAINEELLIDDLAIERNRALISVFDFIMSEFIAPDWLTKTSLIDVTHKIRDLLPYQIYRQDNQEFVLDYIQEIKPYHTQIKEFNLTYFGLDTYYGDLTDFDLPAYYNTSLAVPQYISPVLTDSPVFYTVSSANSHKNFDADTPTTSALWESWPYVNWYNNFLLEVNSVNLTSGGSGYTSVPEIVVTGICNTSAELTCTINDAGQVSSVTVVNPGSGYANTATITFVGGGGTGARASAVMGNDLVRSLKTVLKYDRCEYASTVVDWAPDTSYDFGALVRYDNRLWTPNVDDSTPPLASETFDPFEWTLVNVGTTTLEFNSAENYYAPVQITSATNRTKGLYTATINQTGLDLGQLIEGIDYPGVQVYGLPYLNPDNLNLDAQYRSAYTDILLGTQPYDLNIVGGAYIDTYSSHAPEELIPGAEFDTLDLRVFTTPGADWNRDGHGFAEHTSRIIVDQLPQTYNFSAWYDYVPYLVSGSLTNQTTGISLALGVNFTVDWIAQTFTITSGCNIGDTLAGTAYGLGGGNQLYRELFPGTAGSSVTVPVEYSQIQEVAVWANGQPISGVTFSSGSDNNTLVNFGRIFTNSDVVVVYVIGPTVVNGTAINYSWSTPVTEYIVSTGTVLYTLSNPIEYSSQDNLIVTVDGIRARPSAGIEYTGDDTTSYFELPGRLGFSQEIISPTDVRVYVNDTIQILGVNYEVTDYDSSTMPRQVVFDTPPGTGDRVLICVTTNAQVIITGNSLTFNASAGLIPVPGSIIAVTSWNDPRQQNILTTVYVGPISSGTSITQSYDATDFDSPVFGDPTEVLPGQYDLTLGVNVVSNGLFLPRANDNPDRLIVTLNGRQIFANDDFIVRNDEIILNYTLNPADVVVITELTNSVTPNALAFRIFQDMRGVQTSYRITTESTTELVQSVSITDDIIYVKNASALASPTSDRYDNYTGNGTNKTFEINQDSVISIEVYVDNTLVSPTRYIVGVNYENIVFTTAPAAGAQIVIASKVFVEYGVITIDGERITYKNRNLADNTISELRRGTAGTAITEHSVGTNVYDMGFGNLLPDNYQDHLVGDTTLAIQTTNLEINADPSTTLYYFNYSPVYSVVSVTIDGELVDPADYTVDPSAEPEYIEFDTAPSEDSIIVVKVRTSEREYGQTVFVANSIDTTGNDSTTLEEAIEVYVGGIRQYAGYTIINDSPVTIEFDVAPSDSVDVTIVVRRGLWWYNISTVAEKNLPLQKNNSLAARFIRGEI